VNPKTPAPVTAADPLDTLGIMSIVPVVVIDDVAQAAPLAKALVDGGLSCAEITLRTPAALPALAVIAAHGGLLAGAGTLLEPAQAAQAAGAGAHFAVSPGFDPDIIEACRAQSLPILPGAATATEIQQVRRWKPWAARQLAASSASSETDQPDPVQVVQITVPVGADTGFAAHGSSYARPSHLLMSAPTASRQT
jgi:2-keto-3-deoxy-6-phosphogluconate aldolase